MARAQKYLRAFGIFSAGSLVTYATLRNNNHESNQIGLNKQKIHSINKEASKDSTIKFDKNYNSAIEKCKAKLEQWKAKECIPGIVVGVSVKGQTVWKYASGFSDIENDVKCSENTVMRIASISKLFTSAYLMKMVEQGKLDLDEPIRTYLTKEEFPDKFWDGKLVDITLRQLAAHLGGIRHYKPVENNSPLVGEFLSNQKYDTAIESLNIFKNDPLLSKPGTNYLYTTFGWSLISAVIESRLPKRKFGHFFQNFIRNDLGLRYTKLDENLPLIPNRSKYYFIHEGQLQNCPAVDNSLKWAGGGLISNISDLLKFGNLMLYSAVSTNLPGFFTTKQMEEMWSPVPESIQKGGFAGHGVGWVSVKDGGPKVAFGPEAFFENFAFHTGAAVGSTSVLLVEPKEQIIVVILANLQSAHGVLDSALELTKQFSDLN